MERISPITGSLGTLSNLFLADKFKSRGNIILPWSTTSYEKITCNEVDVANTFNNFFSNFIKNLKIPEHYVEDKLPHS